MENKQRRGKKADYSAGQVSLRLTPEIKSRLWRMAERLQVTPSQLLRALLNGQLDVWENMFQDQGLADVRPATRREAEATFGRMLLMLSKQYAELIEENYNEYGDLKPPVRPDPPVTATGKTRKRNR